MKKSNLTPELKTYFIINAKKTIKRIKNQKAIATIAMKELESKTIDNVSEDVDEDWVDRFMDSAAYVSSEDLQLVWGKILAKEFDKPNTMPPNMIRILSEITPYLANVFNKICGMKIWAIPLMPSNEICKEATYNDLFVPYKNNADNFRMIGINFEDLQELETLGLIKFGSVGGFVKTNLPSDKLLLYTGKKLLLIKDFDKNNMPAGDIMLTSAGEALNSILNTELLEIYDVMLEKYLSKSGCKFLYNHGFTAKEENGALTISETYNEE